MSGFMSFAACILVFAAIVIAKPFRRWVPVEDRGMQMTMECMAMVLVYVALFLAFYAGRVSA